MARSKPKRKIWAHVYDVNMLGKPKNYEIEKVQNTVEYIPDQVVDISELRDLIQSGVEVVINQVKRKR